MSNATLARMAVRRRIGPARSCGFGSDECGSTAVEFGMVAGPFLMMLFGIVAVGLHFFTTFTIENAVDQAARQIRTGQAQQAGTTQSAFKTAVCSRMPGYVDCAGKVRVNVQNFPDFSSITTPSCTDGGGNLVADANTTYAPGTSSNVVLVTVCYEYDFAANIPFLKVGNMANGAALIQASATFKTEPYSN